MTNQECKESRKHAARLYFSDTGNYASPKQLGVSLEEYAELINDSFNTSTAEGHVKTYYGIRVYAQL
jgi:hypothetical protein